MSNFSRICIAITYSITNQIAENRLIIVVNLIKNSFKLPFSVKIMSLLKLAWLAITAPALEEGTGKLEIAFFESVYRITYALGTRLLSIISTTYVASFCLNTYIKRNTRKIHNNAVSCNLF